MKTVCTHERTKQEMQEVQKGTTLIQASTNSSVKLHACLDLKFSNSAYLDGIPLSTTETKNIFHYTYNH